MNIEPLDPEAIRDPELLEVIERCEALGVPDSEKWALRYAREMYLNPEKVNAVFCAEGKRHYTEAQIMELGSFIAFHYGMQVFVRTLDAVPRQRRGTG